MAQFIVCDHLLAGSTRGRAASRSSDAADLPPTLVVFSKCGVGKFNPEGDAILFVSGDLWVEKKNVQNLNLSKSQNPRVTILKSTQNSCFPSFVAIQYNECR